MTLKDQWKKIKDNWLIILVLVVVLVVFTLGGSNIGQTAMTESLSYAGMSSSKMAADYGGAGGMMPYPSSDFAPEVTQRIITKTASMTEEIERGKFQDAESKLKNIVSSSDSYMLNENVNAYGEDWEKYYVGSYEIKVDTSKYSSIVSQLKELGKVKSFNENSEDITGQYTDIKGELEAEKERLKRYEQMYADAKITEDKINLNDRIFNQQRTIKYLEDAIKNMDNKVSYSTIYLTMNEKQSTYANIALVKLGNLVKTLVDSFNGLLYLLFAVLPWLAAGLIIWLVVRFVKKRA